MQLAHWKPALGLQKRRARCRIMAQKFPSFYSRNRDAMKKAKKLLRIQNPISPLRLLRGGSVSIGKRDSRLRDLPPHPPLRLLKHSGPVCASKAAAALVLDQRLIPSSTKKAIRDESFVRVRNFGAQYGRSIC